MKKAVSLLFGLLFFFAGAFRVWGQVRYGGYLSFEYIKGQVESPYPKGNLENILGGFLAVGEVSPSLGFALEVRSRSVSLFHLEQAWVGYLPSSAINIRAGLFLVPFGLYNRANRPHETLLIRTPLNLAEAYPSSWRELGLCVEGRIGIVSYSAYIGNGLGEAEDLKGSQQFRDNNLEKGKGGRLALALSNYFQIGASYYNGKYDESGERRLILEGVDVTWVTVDWEVHGEYTRAKIENPDPFGDGEIEGYAIWMSMNLGKLQPVASFQKVTYDDAYHGIGFVAPLQPGEGIFQNRSRWTLGFRYILGPNVFLKFEYDWNREKDLKIKDNVFQIQAALGF